MSSESTRTQVIMAHIFCVAQQFTSVTVYVLGKKIMATVDVYHLVFLRLMFVIPIVFLAASLFTRKLSAFRMPLKTIGLVVASGIFGIFLAQSVAFVGLSMSTATNMSIISAPCTPLFTALFSVIRGSDKMNIPKGFGFLSSIIGALLLLQVWNFEFKGKTLGNVLIVGSAMLNAFNSLLQKHILNEGFHPLVVQAYVCSVGMVSYIIGYSGLGLFESDSWVIPGNIWIYISIVGVIATALPWCVSIIALKHTSPLTTAVYVVLQPLIAGFIGVVLMGEVLTWIQMLGSLLVILGLVLVNAQPIVQKLFNRTHVDFALLPQIEETKEIELKVVTEKGDAIVNATPEEVNYELTKDETNAFVIDDEDDRKDGADYFLPNRDDERKDGADYLPEECPDEADYKPDEATYKPVEEVFAPGSVRLRHQHEAVEDYNFPVTLHKPEHVSMFVKDGADYVLEPKMDATDFFSTSCKGKDISLPPTPTMRPVL